MKHRKSEILGITAVTLVLFSCSQALEATATLAPTQTLIPSPTTTKALEPTATQLVENPSSDQKWLLEKIFPLVREAGCEPSYEVGYNPEFKNSIPWTVDADGNIVQGVIVLDLCGSYNSAGEPLPPYAAFRGHGAISLLEEIPTDLVGFVTEQKLKALHDLLLCMQNGMGSTLADVVVPADIDVLIALSNVGFYFEKTAEQCSAENAE